jgi:hypothetical protein
MADVLMAWTAFPAVLLPMRLLRGAREDSPLVVPCILEALDVYTDDGSTLSFT